jgi:hypothetical protein
MIKELLLLLLFLPKAQTMHALPSDTKGAHVEAKVVCNPTRAETHKV